MGKDKDDQVLKRVECALTKGWQHIWLETNSEATALAFNMDKLPWMLLPRWMNCKGQLVKFKISSIWREANFTVDTLAKAGATLQDNVTNLVNGKPD
ncbi:hypothetical protein IFM89_027426 [Coptis chinensis]|uniref:RNase H type-1 domain-containing protein n=1 Tax=Coptis chinensis TaxID=261450 RepID=A0A835H9K3_9MAGN|nr:hypothetical protein IFM89_027426 [Coptis chinensis]